MSRNDTLNIIKNTHKTLWNKAKKGSYLGNDLKNETKSG